MFKRFLKLIGLGPPTVVKTRGDLTGPSPASAPYGKSPKHVAGTIAKRLKRASRHNRGDEIIDGIMPSSAAALIDGTLLGGIHPKFLIVRAGSTPSAGGADASIVSRR